jgi:hypothetical protein
MVKWRSATSALAANVKLLRAMSVFEQLSDALVRNAYSFQPEAVVARRIAA